MPRNGGHDRAEIFLRDGGVERIERAVETGVDGCDVALEGLVPHGLVLIAANPSDGEVDGEGVAAVGVLPPVVAAREEIDGMDMPAGLGDGVAEHGGRASAPAADFEHVAAERRGRDCSVCSASSSSGGVQPGTVSTMRAIRAVTGAGFSGFTSSMHGSDGADDIAQGGDDVVLVGGIDVSIERKAQEAR